MTRTYHSVVRVHILSDGVLFWGKDSRRDRSWCGVTEGTCLRVSEGPHRAQLLTVCLWIVDRAFNLLQTQLPHLGKGRTLPP